jgi:REP element-mobilizing transposase RayT
MQLRSRKNIRLKGYDYRRKGAYYVTICAHDRAMLFGDVLDGIMVPNAIGNFVHQCWQAIPEHMPMVVCDSFVVMPNHVHGIIVITDVAAGEPHRRAGEFADPTTPAPPPPPAITADHQPRRPPIAIMVKNSLGHIMQTFKAAVSRQVYRNGLLPRGKQIWQSGYYDRIIRDDAERERIARYIHDNPINWGKDRFHR